MDVSPKCLATKRDSALVCGQLLTPLTRYANAGGTFAIDNGAFTGLDRGAFARLVRREEPNRDRCLWVVVPDIVGSGRRTMELWQRREKFVGEGWPLAFAAQDGSEDLDIPWNEMACLFIGGRDPWKDSQAVVDLLRTARALGLRTHVGRVNTLRRYRRFESEADTCDGSGVARYEHMLRAIEAGMQNDEPELFPAEE